MLDAETPSLRSVMYRLQRAGGAAPHACAVHQTRGRPLATPPHRPRALLGALRTAGDVDGPLATPSICAVKTAEGTSPPPRC